MPTLVELDGFQHGVLKIDGPWYTATDSAVNPCHDGTEMVFDETQPRTSWHRWSLKYSGNTSTAVELRSRTFTGANNVAVVSFYFRLVSAPAAEVLFFRFLSSTNATIRISSTGAIVAVVGSGTARTSANTYADGNWHRIDAFYDMTTTTGKMDVQVDGTDVLTQATGSVTVANLTNWTIGTNVAQAAAFDVWCSDLVISFTSADYPIGDHIVKFLHVNRPGTHNTGSGSFTANDGSTSGFEKYVTDPWDGSVSPVLTQDGSQGADTYVRQTAIDTAAYLEFLLEPPTDDVIWDVKLLPVQAALDSATADNCKYQLLTGGATVADSGTVDPSTSATRYFGGMLMSGRPSGGWDKTKLADARYRWGFSGDVTPNPIVNALGVEYASPWSPNDRPPAPLPKQVPLVQSINHRSPI